MTGFVFSYFPPPPFSIFVPETLSSKTNLTMSEFAYPFRGFPDECYRLEEGLDGNGPLEIKKLRSVNLNSWLKDEEERLYWQFRRLRESRAEKVAATMAPDEEIITEEHLARFHRFSELPSVIRLGIYEFSEGGYTRQRIHRINGRPDTPLEFMSNQPLSQLLRTCAESRCKYLKKIECTFAFETYVNYSRDIFYFIDTNAPGDFQRLAVFFNCEPAQPILRVALRQALYQHVNFLIPVRMNDLVEVMILWEGWNGWEEKWKARDVVIRKAEEERVGQGGDPNRSSVMDLFRGMMEQAPCGGDLLLGGTGRRSSSQWELWR
ncbi:hypothetical protein BKA65DRAFT_549225 [Rhexocercosporidium sp. MPI-PUGE-AT-0058]|nr:hypothetical protein BKA65DRAFT_549225 [Rhexocercosporidium sp. MPI-PUGE-AT-0058]